MGCAVLCPLPEDTPAPRYNRVLLIGCARSEYVILQCTHPHKCLPLSERGEAAIDMQIAWEEFSELTTPSARTWEFLEASAVFARRRLASLSVVESTALFLALGMPSRSVAVSGPGDGCDFAFPAILYPPTLFDEVEAALGHDTSSLSPVVSLSLRERLVQAFCARLPISGSAAQAMAHFYLTGSTLPLETNASKQTALRVKSQVSIRRALDTVWPRLPVVLGQLVLDYALSATTHPCSIVVGSELAWLKRPPPLALHVSQECPVAYIKERWLGEYNKELPCRSRSILLHCQVDLVQRSQPFRVFRDEETAETIVRACGLESIAFASISVHPRKIEDGKKARGKDSDVP